MPQTPTILYTLTDEAPYLATASLLSIVQMPAGIPVATFAIGVAGAANAALFAAALLAPEHADISAALEAFRAKQTDDVMAHDDPRT